MFIKKILNASLCFDIPDSTNVDYGAFKNSLAIQATPLCTKKKKNSFQPQLFLTLFAGLGTDILHLTSLGLRKIQKFTCYIGYTFVHLLYRLHLCAPRKNPFQSQQFLTLFAGLGTDILHLCAPNKATPLCTAAEIWVLTPLCTKQRV